MSRYPFDVAHEGEDIMARSKSQTEVSDANPDATLEEKLFALYKAMSLPRLIEKITYLDCPLMRHYFLICYRAFAKPMEVVRLLIMRYEGPTEDNAELNQIIAFRAKKDIIRKKTLDLVADMQQELTSQDFDEDDMLDEVISDFIASQAVAVPQDQLLVMSGAMAQRKRPSIVRELIRKISEATTQLNVMDVVWAITCKDHRLFANIRPNELLDLAWTGKHKHEKSPNVVAITEHFNWVTTWIMLRIVLGETVEQRRDLIEFFIQVGMKFLEINNFNGVMQIVCSCNSIPISRLHKTWDAVPEATMKNFKMLENLLSYEKNSANYRQALKKATGSPCLPFIGLILTDITFAVTGNPVKLGKEKELVSVRFVETVGKVIDGMMKHQANGYKPTEQTSLLVLDEEYQEDELYELSVMREPKASADVHNSPTVSTPRVRAKNKDRSRTVSINTHELAPRVSDATPQDHDYLFADADIIPLSAGEVLMNEGVTDNNLYMVERGTVELYKNGDHLVMTLHTFEIFNVVSFLDNSSCWATVKAVGPCKIASIPADVARDTLAIDPALGARFYKLFAKTTATMMRSAMVLKTLPQTWRSATTSPQIEARDGSNALRPSRSSSGSDLLSGFKVTKRSGSGVYGRPGSTSVKAFKCKRGALTGTMSVSATHCYFNSKVFGLTKAISIEMKDVVAVTKKKSTLTIDFGGQKKSKEFVFALEEDLNEVHRMLTNIQTMLNKRIVLRESSISVPNPNAVASPPVETDKSAMDESEWKKLLRGAHSADYPKGTVFIKENKRPKEFFYIVSGNCAIQKTTDDKTTTLAIRSANDVFGEMCFLDENQVASASVVADTDVTVYTLKSSFVNILLSHFGEMAPKFYKYLALVLIKRLKE